jgi:hypothetical protein
MYSGKVKEMNFLNSHPLGVRKGAFVVYLDLWYRHTKPRFCTPQISDQGHPQTSNISEHLRRVSPTHGQGHLNQCISQKTNPKMFSSFPQTRPQTINANKYAAPSRYFSSICNSGTRTACHNLAMASLRQTKPSHTHNMEHILQRRHHQSLHRRLRLSTR